MKKTPSLNDFCHEDKYGRTAADKFLRSKGIKRGSRFAVGDGYLSCRNFFLTKDGHLAEMDEEAKEYIYKALVLGRGHLWKERAND